MLRAQDRPFCTRILSERSINYFLKKSGSQTPTCSSLLAHAPAPSPPENVCPCQRLILAVHFLFHVQVDKGRRTSDSRKKIEKTQLRYLSTVARAYHPRGGRSRHEDCCVQVEHSLGSGGTF